MAGNEVCASCGVAQAEVLCFCDFPLPVLCTGPCLQKHRYTPGFHHEMTVAVAPIITNDNFRVCQAWLFSLSRAHQSLRKNLHSIDRLERDIETTFTQVKLQLESLQLDYLTSIRTLKATLSDLIESAISETTINALNPNPLWSNPVSKLIWNDAKSPNKGPLDLYDLEVRVGRKEDIWNAVNVKFTPLYADLPGIEVSGMKRVDIVRSGEKLENEGRCRTCNVRITPENQHFHPCECDTCLIEAIISPEKQPNCVHCNEPYSQSLVKKLRDANERCHCCGIAVSKVEIETKLACRPCSSCVTLRKERSFLFFTGLIGNCSSCPSTSTPLDPTNYESTTDTGFYGESSSSCCASSASKRIKLACGHFCCKSHYLRLKRCRLCHSVNAAAVLPSHFLGT